MGDTLKAIQHELETYADDYLTLEIVDVDTPDGDLNEDESGSFTIRVVNDGVLDVHDLQVRVVGLNGVKVNNGASAKAKDLLTSKSMFDRIKGHNGREPADGAWPIYFFPSRPTDGPQSPLFSVHVESYKLDTQHLLSSHAEGGQGTKAYYRRQVFPG